MPGYTIPRRHCAERAGETIRQLRGHGNMQGASELNLSLYTWNRDERTASHSSFAVLDKGVHSVILLPSH